MFNNANKNTAQAARTLTCFSFSPTEFRAKIGPLAVVIEMQYAVDRSKQDESASVGKGHDFEPLYIEQRFTKS